MGRSQPAADIYGFGLLLFEMLTARKPYAGSTPLEIALALESQRTRPNVSAVRADVPQPYVVPA